MPLRRFAAFVLVGSACALFDGCTTMCTEEARAGLSVVVNDGKVCDATVVFRDGAYSEMARANEPNCSYVGAFERPGTYTIEVSENGSPTVTTTATVAMDDDGCHVVGQVVHLTLEEADGGT